MIKFKISTVCNYTKYTHFIDNFVWMCDKNDPL